jgi:hypothetical protein
MRILLLVVALGLCVGCSKRTVKNTAPAPDESASAKPHPAPADKNKKSDKDEPNWLTDPRFQKDQSKLDPNQTPPQAAPPSGPGAAGGKQSWGLTPPPGGWQGPVPGVQPNPMPVPGAPGVPAGPGPMPAPPGPMPAPPGPGKPPAGPVPNPPPGGVVGQLQPNPVPGNPPALAPGAGTPLGAGKKVVALADMRDLQIFIHDSSLASGKMPTPAEIFDALLKAGSPAAEHVKSGAIILTGATERESVWAYETRAVTQGGLVVSQNGVETLTAAELKQRVGK